MNLQLKNHKSSLLALKTFSNFEVVYSFKNVKKIYIAII
ncbi:hypothetical protein H374_4770 [Rickettsia prowazekii str. NMRC Madrid E]|nr:hypothetical protein H374_4770 [Rickettsia prowazekii str. NMRC Madrid E]